MLPKYIDGNNKQLLYAGAMGLPQFMPSSFRAYAVDFDNDGHINIWSNPDDAIGSVASYFKRHGWVAGEPVVARAEVQGDRLKDKDHPELFSGLVWTGQQALPLGLIDGLGSASSVARDVIGEKELVDFTVQESALDRFSKKLGAGVAERRQADPG